MFDVVFIGEDFESTTSVKRDFSTRLYPPLPASTVPRVDKYTRSKSYGVCRRT
jgi:hypothetical protein